MAKDLKMGLQLAGVKSYMDSIDGRLTEVITHNHVKELTQETAEYIANLSLKATEFERKFTALNYLRWTFERAVRNISAAAADARVPVFNGSHLVFLSAALCRGQNVKTAV